MNILKKKNGEDNMLFYYKYLTSGPYKEWTFGEDGKKIAEEFQKIVSGYNFITPFTTAIFANDEYIVELSEQAKNDMSGLLSPDIRGVTVANRITKEHDTKKSKMFDSEIEAIEYIEHLLN